ncbi:MAG: hypothetical protein F6K58_07915 [Symploca sp. SIO2E9]|nr:hypothetical protein [Symploca sp. SIO2E9]
MGVSEKKGGGTSKQTLQTLQTLQTRRIKIPILLVNRCFSNSTVGIANSGKYNERKCQNIICRYGLWRPKVNDHSNAFTSTT